MSNALGSLELTAGLLFDEVPWYISVQDRDFNVLSANRALIADFEAPVGRRCYAAFKGRDERCPECPVARTFEDGKEHSSEEIIFDRRTLPHHVQVRTHALRSHEGEIVAVMELFSDLTVQKELERRLHDSLSRFQNLFDLAPCYISVQDRELRVMDANGRFHESFGAPAGGHCYEIYKRRKERCPECPVLKTFADGKMHTGEHVWVDEKGREILVVVQTAPMRDRHGHIAEVMEVSTDITEVRALQDQLALLGRLVGSVAHSIKNVLEGLRGGVYIVNLGFRDKNQDDIRTGWSMVERNVERISGLVMDMLHCAKERSPRQLPVQLRTVVLEVVESFQTRARECGVRLETEVADDGLTILGEPKDIHALVSNLITNAIDACCSDQDEGKRSHVTVRLRREEDRAVLEVEDNGIGMDEDARGKLFTTFFSTKGAFGTGLGMMVSHKVVIEHGGTLSVRSSPAAGATFTVKFPPPPGEKAP